MVSNQQHPEPMKTEEWKKKIGKTVNINTVETLHGRQTARHLVTAFLVSMPIKDEITCGDGCFCVGENTSIIKKEWYWNNGHNNNNNNNNWQKTELFTDNST